MSDPLSINCPPYESVSSVCFHHDQLWAGTSADFLDRLDDRFDYRKDDIWLISYPRSGTAWTYAVLYAVLYAGDMGALQQARNEGKIPKFLPLEVGSAGGVDERIDAWNALPSPRVIPTHLPWRLYPGRALDCRCKRVYVVRDPRDVAVSLYHFHRSHRLLGYYKGTWEAFFECFISGRVIYGSWCDHTLGWRPRVEESPGGMLALRYEEMKQDLAAQIRSIGGFLDITLTPQAVAAIEEYCSFESMRSDPFTNRQGDPIMDSSIAPFLRKGTVGDWRNYFTRAQSQRLDAEWKESCTRSS